MFVTFNMIPPRKKRAMPTTGITRADFALCTRVYPPLPRTTSISRAIFLLRPIRTPNLYTSDRGSSSSVAPSSSTAMTGFVLSSPEFYGSVALKMANWFASHKPGFLTMVYQRFSRLHYPLCYNYYKL